MIEPSALECLPLGGEFVLHNRASGAVVLTSGLGRDLLSLMNIAAGREAQVALVSRAGGLDPGSAAAALDEIAAAWKAAGLLLDRPAPYPDPVSWRPPRDPHALHLGLGQKRVACLCEDETLHRQLSVILGSYVATDEAPAEVTVSILDLGGGCGVFSGTTPLWGRASPDEARHFALREILAQLSGPGAPAAHLHGAAVVMEGQAICLLGESGAGKTSLALELLGAGARLAGDDHLGLTRDGEAILAMPTAMALKGEMRARPEAMGLDILATVDDLRSGVRLVVLARQVAPGTRLPVRALVFPEFRTGADLQVARLAPGAALRRLFTSGARVAGGAGIGPLLHLLETRPALALRYGEGGAAPEALQEALRTERAS